MLNVHIETHERVEIARLINKASLLVQCLGGVFPGLPHEVLPGVQNVLEMNCGPGGWLLECAHMYQHLSVTGIDTRPAMIDYIDTVRTIQRRSTIHAHLVPHYLSLPFDDATFDIVSLQCVSLHLKRNEWPQLLQECFRILRPTGFLRLTEFELPQSNAPAHKEWLHLCWRAMNQRENGVLSNHHRGLLCELEPMVSNAGFHDTVLIPHLVNYSYGAPFSTEWKRDVALLIKRSLPEMAAMNLIHFDDIASFERRVLSEMMMPTFHALQPFLTVWGKKTGGIL